MVFIGLATVSLTVAGVFALQGLWVPLPFAGGELLLLGVCLNLVQNRLDQFDLIACGDQQLRVYRMGRTTDQQMRFPAAWVRILERRGRWHGHAGQLIVTAHGRELEVGAFLTEDERGQLAVELRRQLDPVSAWPK